LLKLTQVETKADKALVKEIIETYHSYVPTNASVGRRIDWLIHYNDQVVGMIGVGSSVYPPPKDLLTYLNVSKSQYKEVFNSVANNWRFCMKASIPNLGTQVLKTLRKQAPTAWNVKYNNQLSTIITFVGGGNNGAVYRADNWKVIGETAGLPKHKSTSMKWSTADELKEKFVKPTGENKKIILVTQSLK
jgi:hypothetical protein